MRADLDLSCEESGVESVASRVEDEIEDLIRQVNVYGRHGRDRRKVEKWVGSSFGAERKGRRVEK